MKTSGTLILSKEPRPAPKTCILETATGDAERRHQSRSGSLHPIVNRSLEPALQSLWEKGFRTITAATLADELWPTARRNNSHGQQFNLAAGVAGKMLRFQRCRACVEVINRLWKIVPEYFTKVPKTC